LIVTGVTSLAVPVNEGALSLDGDGGAFNVTSGGSVFTTNVTVLLTPAGFPSELSWVAVAVYVPFERLGSLFVVKVALLGVAVALATSKLAEFRIRTTTLVVSVAVPVKVGVRLLAGDFGWTNVTVGGAVFTMNVIGLLTPGGFPAELGCVATAEYSPLVSTGVAAAEVQAAPVPVAVAVETGRPSGLPALALDIATVTGVMSLAVPVNDGSVLFDRGFASGFNVTLGDAVSTVKETGALTPAGFPTELGWVAVAVYSPLVRAGLAGPELQLAPLPAAVAVETSVALSTLVPL
jgi:hypothetical protein